MLTEAQFKKYKEQISDAKVQCSKVTTALNRALLEDAEEQQKNAKSNFDMGLITYKEYFKQVKDIFETAEKRAEKREY